MEEFTESAPFILRIAAALSGILAFIGALLNVLWPDSYAAEIVSLFILIASILMIACEFSPLVHDIVMSRAQFLGELPHFSNAS